MAAINRNLSNVSSAIESIKVRVPFSQAFCLCQITFELGAEGHPLLHYKIPGEGLGEPAPPHPQGQRTTVADAAEIPEGDDRCQCMAKGHAIIFGTANVPSEKLGPGRDEVGTSDNHSKA